jgi:hypothetical protein
LIDSEEMHKRYLVIKGELSLLEVSRTTAFQAKHLLICNHNTERLFKGVEWNNFVFAGDLLTDSLSLDMGIDPMFFDIKEKNTEEETVFLKPSKLKNKQMLYLVLEYYSAEFLKMYQLRRWGDFIVEREVLTSLLSEKIEDAKNYYFRKYYVDGE